MISDDIRVLVNSASVFEWDGMTDIAPARFQRHMAINTLAPALLMQALNRHLPDGVEGCVVNVLDQKLFNMNPDHLSYTLSKAALRTLTDMAARDFAPRIRVNAVAPGYTLPTSSQTEAEAARLRTGLPLGRGADVTDLADAVAMLVENRSINGAELLVDAGEHLLARPRDSQFPIA